MVCTPHVVCPVQCAICNRGIFKFLVLKLRGRSDRQRILVRGHNYATEGKLVEDLNRQMIQLSAQHGLPVEVIEVRG